MYPLGIAGRWTGFGAAAAVAAAAAGASATGSGGVNGLFRRGFGERGAVVPLRLGGLTARAVEPERMGRVIEVCEPEAGRVR